MIYSSGIVLTNIYNVNGYLEEIKYGSVTLWKLNSENSYGQPVNYSIGNLANSLTVALTYDEYGRLKTKTTGQMKQTYVYDNASGNLLSRDYRVSGAPGGLTESFSYDNLNRLTGLQVTGAGLMSVTYSPDGNINTKTDAGSYTYDPSRQNAVTAITGNNGTISLPDQVIAYNGNNLATRIEEDNSAYAIYYNPLKQRIKTVCTTVGSPAITRYYSGSYEKTITGSTVTETHYVSSPTGLVAILVKQGTAVQTYYVETDHLGSVTGIINTDKTYASSASYDAWGRRRNPSDWSYNNIPAPVITDRGFTGHEHLDRFGLINMNGRMYDPVAGRFLGVDPVVQAPDYSQSYNGYSYCWNNPLKYTDPSGMKLSLPDDNGAYLSAYSHWMTDIRFPDLGDSGYNENWLVKYLYASNLNFYGYTYNYSANTYYSNYTGKSASWDEVYYNYVVPNSITDLHEVVDILNTLDTSADSGPDNPHENSNQISQIIDPCGIDAWTIFPNRLMAVLYIKTYSDCKKEKFFYMTELEKAIVGPWNDATKTHVSPRYRDPFNDGWLRIDNVNYRVNEFTHTHFNGPHSSDEDVRNATWFAQWGVEVRILFNGQYYRVKPKANK